MRLTLPISAEEWVWVVRIGAKAGLDAAGAIRVALWNFGRHVGLDLPIDVFTLRDYAAAEATKIRGRKAGRGVYAGS